MIEASRIRLLAMDVDGVLTSGEIVYSDAGEEIKTFNIQDGLGIVVARRVGLKSAIITGRESPALARRAEELGVDVIVQGCVNKGEGMRRVLVDLALSREEAAFIGDDINDIPAFRECGLKIAVANSSDDLKALADHVTEKPGGHGAVREAIELILKSQGKWADAVETFVRHIEQPECRT